MKALKLSMLLICSTTVALAQHGTSDNYVIKGKVAGISHGTVELGRSVDVNRSVEKVNAAKVKNGEFILSGKLETPEMMTITVMPGNWHTNAFIENGNINIQIDTAGATHYDYVAMGGAKGALLKNVKITGSKSQDDFKDYVSVGVKDRSNYLATLLKYVQSYSLENPSSVAGVYMLQYYYQYNTRMPVSEMEKLLTAYTGDARKSRYFKWLSGELAQKKAVLPGSMIQDFTLLKSDSTEFTLSSMRGRYVLLDFWASWCKPCREAIPHWKEVYAKYNPKGFEIIGITNDLRWNDWRKAMAAEQMPWLQLADEFPIKGMPSKVLTRFRSSTIPWYVLLDKDGKILASTSSKEQIDQQLIGIFGN